MEGFDNGNDLRLSGFGDGADFTQFGGMADFTIVLAFLRQAFEERFGDLPAALVGQFIEASSACCDSASAMPPVAS
jgi:hypothetical protein